MRRKITSFIAMLTGALMLVTAMLPTSNVNAANRGSVLLTTAGSQLLEGTKTNTLATFDFDDDAALWNGSPIAATQKPIKLALQTAKSSEDTLTSIVLGPNDSVDLKFFGCNDYKTTSLGWKTSNKNVCTVNNNGVVTPVAPGVAEITYEAIGYKCQPVTVLVAAPAYSVYIADQVSKKACSKVTFTDYEPVDLCFVGAKGYSGNNHAAKWYSLDTDVCAVDNKGVITPLANGETYVCVAITNRNNDKPAYDVRPVKVVVSINEKTPDATPTVAPDKAPEVTPEVTPEAEEYKITQKAYNKIFIKTSNEITSLTCDYLPIVTCTAVKGGYDVTFATSILRSIQYELTDGLDTYKFVGITGDPDTVKISYECYGAANAAYADAEVTLSAKVYDANGIELPDEVFHFTDNGNELYDTVLYMGSVGERHNIAVETGTSKLKAQTVIVAAKEPAYALTEVNAKIVDSTGDTAKVVALSDEGTNFVTLTAKDNRGNELHTKAGVAYENEYGYIEFGTSGTVVEVMTDGSIYPIKVGTANIIVYFVSTETDKKVAVGQISVEVKPERKVAQVLLTDDYGKVLSTLKLQTTFEKKASINVVLKDQYGQNFTDDYEIKTFKGKDETTALTIGAGSETDQFIVTAVGETTTDKTSAYSIKVTTDNNCTKTIPVTVYNSDNVAASKSQAVWACDTSGMKTDVNASLGALYNIDYAYAAYADCGVVGGATVYTGYQNLRGLYDGVTKTNIEDITGQTSTTDSGDIYVKITIDGTVLHAADLVISGSHESKVLFTDGTDANTVQIALPAGEEKCTVKVEFYKYNSSSDTMTLCKSSVNNTWKNNDDKYISTKTVISGMIPADEYVDDATWFADYCTVSATILGRNVDVDDIVFVETIKTSDASKYLKAIVYDVEGIRHTEVINKLYR